MICHRTNAPEPQFQFLLKLSVLFVQLFCLLHELRSLRGLLYVAPFCIDHVVVSWR